jgi:hypothetical protein
MSVLGTYIKQPAEVSDYDIDYTDWLADGDAVADSVGAVTHTVMPSGLTLDVDPVVTNSGTRTKHWISGGTHGVTYKVEVTATTTGGRTIQNEFKIKVKDY